MTTFEERLAKAYEDGYVLDRANHSLAYDDSPPKFQVIVLFDRDLFQGIGDTLILALEKAINNAENNVRWPPSANSMRVSTAIVRPKRSLGTLFD